MAFDSELAKRDDLGAGGFAESAGVKIHYVAKGAGPLLVLIHGAPDFWYTWRFQMPALAERFEVAAIDLRGYNESDRPEGVENYTVDKLIGDVDAVVKHFGRATATIAGHDWGGFIAWRYAMAHPDRTDRLVVLNMPHPRCLERELAMDPEQEKASAYARQFQKDGRGLLPDGSAVELTPELMAGWVAPVLSRGDEAAKRNYVEALERLSIEAMVNYYKANYPRPPYKEESYPPVKCPVLMFHGLDDPWLLPGALNDTWRWLESDLTMVTVPKAGHWVHHDVADLVTKRMLGWLTEER
jgi:pimeloyl-ACP methyl ester carboxylesterase